MSVQFVLRQCPFWDKNPLKDIYPSEKQRKLYIAINDEPAMSEWCTELGRLVWEPPPSSKKQLWLTAPMLSTRLAAAGFLSDAFYCFRSWTAWRMGILGYVCGDWVGGFEHSLTYNDFVIPQLKQRITERQRHRDFRTLEETMRLAKVAGQALRKQAGLIQFSVDFFENVSEDVFTKLVAELQQSFAEFRKE